MYRTELKEKVDISKSLLQAISQLKEGERTSRSLITALEGTHMTEAVLFEDQFKLPDLVSMEGGDQASKQEKELLKPPQQTVSKHQKYIHMHFNKEKIKIGAALQREEQRKWAEDALQLKGNIEEDEEVEGDTCKEQLKKERAERYTQRAREREEEEEETEKIEDITEGRTQSKGDSKTKETKKPHGGKKKTEVMQQEVDEEEEDYEERAEGSSRKRRIGCINPREADEFQGFIKTRMEDLMNEMKGNKDLVNLVRKFIRALKVQYDVICLFKNNGAANTEDIVGTIPDTKGIAWQKALDSKELMDADEYNKIIDCCMESHLFQEGSLHLKLEESKEHIMQKCVSLFENVEKAHQANLSIV